MLKSIQISSIYVPDQDQALDFYVGKVGMQVHTDLDLGFMRWLTVCVPGDPSREVLLEKIGGPYMDDKTADQVREVLSKGASGGHLFLTVDDARKTYDDLVAKGVDVTQEPTEQPYGIDFGVRDPFGNSVRFSQPAEVTA
jgi:catechol 2,3-dioxygenase-like lactoylglutathione lyase family enzyme